VAKGKAKTGRLSVFKGHEARLNRAAFYFLAHYGPQTIYDIHKKVKTRKGFSQTRYAYVNKRVRSLEEENYIKKTGVKKSSLITIQKEVIINRVARKLITHEQKPAPDHSSLTQKEEGAKRLSPSSFEIILQPHALQYKLMMMALRNHLPPPRTLSHSRMLCSYMDFFNIDSALLQSSTVLML